MSDHIKLPFVTLLLLVSFASVNAVLFTPSLPDIANFFKISQPATQQTLSWFLIGYTLGQLTYGPIANRFGRKPALYVGIIIQIISSLFCVLAGFICSFPLLVLARFLLAIGSGVGLKMTFTLINECYDPQKASQKVSYVMLAFAIMPGLSIALGGILNTHFGWMSCFYAGTIYGLILLILVTRIPETKKVLDYQALEFGHLLSAYAKQFQNKGLILGGFLMGASTSFIYIFAAIAPFIAISTFHMTSAKYGMANLLPPIGLFVGSLVSARLTGEFPLNTLIKIGIQISLVGVVFMFLALYLNLSPLFFLFGAAIVIYFGLCFILANASSLALYQTHDKANGSAVVSFINMGTATISTLGIGFFSNKPTQLPISYALLCIVMLGAYSFLRNELCRDNNIRC
jgi:DHA1 family bicyclomycin/chloramphenicol resistance-like MFS transporter